ncbi:helix-turn-helix transcriptional regulator [Kitasatospora sp. NPDC048540]|uniref:helix-turn-helix domain-containing protein n=1 Tax=unclassified Kitasatospora TaxID=2633591 RepID=UPI0005398A7B|nr:helix-turn-helix transcriptional regulator [Kitasatospora sp. MBT63]
MSQDRIPDGPRLGERLRRLRLDRGMTQEDLGAATSISVRTISDLERGVSCPRISTIRLLAQALRLTEDQRQEFNRLARIQRDRTARRPYPYPVPGPRTEAYA